MDLEANLGATIQNFALNWLPVMFFVLMCFVVYLLWRTMKLMPRVKPMEITPGSKSVGHLGRRRRPRRGEGGAAGGRRLPARPEALRAAGRARAEGHPLPRAARHRQDARREGGRERVGRHASTRRAPRRSSRCSPASAPHASASSSKRRARTRRRSSSSTSSTPSAARAAATRFNREQDQTLNQLLVELDGFGPRDQVVVMGASNRLQDLDPALLRPGRFDRQILIQPPDLKGRKDILAVHTRGKPLAIDIDLETVARQTAGPHRRRPREHLQRGRDRRRPPQRRSRSTRRTSSTRWTASSPVCSSAACHRQGEADPRLPRGRPRAHVAPDVERLAGQKATIIARGIALGYTLNLPEEERYLHTKEELVDWMIVALAGRAAEQVVFGRVTNGAANDLEKVTELARSMVFEYGMGEARRRRARCAPTTTRCPRRRSGSATPSRRG